MGFVKYFIIYAICAVALAITVTAVDQCVKCEDTDGNCKDKVNTTASDVTTCDLADGQVCERLSYKDDKGIHTIRGCVANTTECKDLKTQHLSDIKDNSTWLCYTCKSNLCNNVNSADSIGISFVSMVAAALITLYLK